MTALINTYVAENISVITLNNLPVNALGHELRTGILCAFEQAIADDNIDAIVIASAGKLFCGGADITEFGSNKAFEKPSLPELCNILEMSTKPVVAAINGMALGGGCELALACDYRIALPQAKFGLPEVNLGLLPGAGGTQRLPRLAGVELALEMIVTGKPVAAKKLLAAGVVDHVVSDEVSSVANAFVESAIAYTKNLVAKQAPVLTCEEISINTDELPTNLFNDFRKSIARRTRGFFAPERCIQAVEAACELPLDQGLKKEGQLFIECMNSSQARAQQHLFFAERSAGVIPDVDRKTPTRDIKKVAIIGSGTMGGGIAMNFLNAGIETIILDLNGEALERGIGVIQKNYQTSVKRGRLSETQMNACMNLLKSTTDYADLNDVDLVIEAVFESINVKQAVFEKLDEVCKQGAILATNTSTLDVNTIANFTKRPEDVLGLHFFSPANVMKLLEIVRGDKTADDVLITSIKLAQKIKKVSVVSGVCFGFIGNRMLEPYGREAERLILEGATPAQIDKVLYDFGMAMGVLSMFDLAGIDVGYFIRQGNKENTYGRDPAYGAVSDKLYQLERFGQKNGRGYYIYEGRDQKADDEVQAFASELAIEFGITQREISDQEILERTIFSLINEGAYILEDGIACRASDIDIVYCYGYGFPAHRGGPMQYANEIGLDKILSAMNQYREQLGAYGEEWFKPSPLLEKLVAQGQSFNEFKS